MDVISKWVLYISLLIFFTACSKEKTKETVFPQEKLENCAATAVENKFIVQWEDGRITTEVGNNREDFLNHFVEENLSRIKFVEQDKMIRLDDFQNIQTNTQNDSETNWGQYQIKADVAWNSGVFGQNVKVAVIDSGVDVEHPQIQSRVAYNKNEIPNNGIDDDKNGFIDDYYGYDFGYKDRDVVPVSDHGTHVAGIIVSEHSSGPIKGVAPDALFVPLNFMTVVQDGGRSYVTGAVGDAIQAILYAAYQRNVQIINASWGSGACSKTLSDVILDVGRNKNVLVVTAAGNSGYNLDYNPEFPSAFNLANQINVGASTSNNMQASFSNTSYSLVHLVAPGMGIWSTVPGNSFESMMGTSMAAPFVSGVAALLWSYRPNASLLQIKEAILAGVDSGPYLVQTKGRVNVEKSMQMLAQKVAP